MAAETEIMEAPVQEQEQPVVEQQSNDGGPVKPTLSDAQKQELAGIIQKMEAAKESAATIKAVVERYTQKASPSTSIATTQTGQPLMTVADRMAQMRSNAKQTIQQELTGNNDLIPHIIRQGKDQIQMQQHLTDLLSRPRSDMPLTHPQIIASQLEQQNRQPIPVPDNEVNDFSQNVLNDRRAAGAFLNQVIKAKPDKAQSIKQAAYINDAMSRIDQDPKLSGSVQKIFNNANKIAKGELDYNVGTNLLTKPEDVGESIATGLKQKNQAFNDYNFFSNATPQEAIKELEKRRSEYDPNEPVGIPNGFWSGVAGGAASQPLKGLIAGMVGGGITALIPGAEEFAPSVEKFVSAAVSANDYRKMSYAQSLQENYHQLVSEGIKPEEAYDKANGLAKDEAAVDALAGAAMMYGGAKIGEIKLPAFSLSNGFKDALKNGLKQGIKGIGEAGAVGLIQGQAQEFKDELAEYHGVRRTSTGEDIKEAVKNGTLLTLGIGVIAKGIDMAGAVRSRILQGLIKATPEQIDGELGNQILSGQLTPDQAVKTKQAIEEHQAIDAKIPDKVKNDDVRVDLQKDIEKRGDLEEQLKTLNKAFHPDVKEKIEKLDERINEKANSPEAKQEEVTEQTIPSPKTTNNGEETKAEADKGILSQSEETVPKEDVQKNASSFPQKQSKGIIAKVNSIEDLAEPRDIALQYFTGGGKVHPDAIKELFGGKDERIRWNVSIKGEKNARRTLLSPNAPTIKAIAHKLWEGLSEEIQKKYNDHDIRNALEGVIQEHNTKTSMAKELEKKFLNKSIEQDFTDEEHKQIEQGMKDAALKHIEDLPKEHQHNLVSLLRKYQDKYGNVNWEAVEKDSNGFDPDILNLPEATQKVLDETIRRNITQRQGESGNTVAESSPASQREATEPRVEEPTNSENQQRTNPTDAGQQTADRVKKAQAEHDKATRALQSAEDKISQKQAKQSDMFGDRGAQSEMFNVDKEEAHAVLDPLRQKVKETKADLEAAQKEHSIHEDKQQELFTPKTEENASTIRSDQGQIRATGETAERGKNNSSENIQSSSQQTSEHGEIKQQEERPIDNKDDFNKAIDDLKKKPPEEDTNKMVNASAIKAQEAKEAAKSDYQKELENKLEGLREAYSNVKYSENKVRKLEEEGPKNIRDFIKRVLHGKTPEDVRADKERLVDMQRQYRKEKAELRAELPKERGTNFLIEKISKAARTGDISQENADLAIDLLRRRPDLFQDLAISITKKGEEENVEGFYNAGQQLVKLFKNPGDETTSVHELLHHTERFLPNEIRDNIIKEWNKTIEDRKAQIQKALKTENDSDEREKLTRGLLYLGLAQERQVEPNSINRKAIEAVMNKYLFGFTESPNKDLQGAGIPVTGKIQKGLGNDWYQLYNPSEWWAVNASKLFRDAQNKPEARTWLAKAKAFYDNLIAAVKKVFTGSSTAAVEKGLKAVLKGNTLEEKEGAQLSKSQKLLNVNANGSPNDVLPDEARELKKILARTTLPEEETRDALKKAGYDEELIDRLMGEIKKEREVGPEELVKQALAVGKENRENAKIAPAQQGAIAKASLKKTLGRWFFDKQDEVTDVKSIIRKNKGQEEFELDKIYHATNKVRDFWNTVPKEKQLAFILGIERPDLLKNQSKDFQDMAKMYKQRLDNVFNVITSAMPDLNYFEDYFPHFWKKPEELKNYFANAYAKAPMEGSKSFAKQRFYDTILQGLKKGYDLETTNLEELVRLAEANAWKFKTARNVFDDMDHLGYLKYSTAADLPADWKGVDDKLFNRMAAYVTKSGDAKIAKGQYMMPPEVAKLLNNYLSLGIKNPIKNVVQKYNTIKNLFQLGMGAFHFTTTSIESLINGGTTGIQKISTFKPSNIASGLKDMLSTATIIPNIYQSVKRGLQVKSDYSKGIVTDDVQRLIDVNAKIGRQKMYSLDTWYNTKKAFGELRANKDFSKIPKLFWNGLLTLPEALNKPLMEKWVPSLKVGGFLRSLESEIQSRGEMNPREFQQAKEKIWDSMDDRLGQVVYDNVFMNKASKDLAFMSIRSAGWSGGTIRTGGKGVGEIPLSTKRLFQGKGITQRTADLISMPLTVGFFGAMYQYMMTGKGPDELKDYFFPKDGTTNPDGTEHRVTLPSYMKDYLAYGKSPAQTLIHKTSPFLNDIVELYQNKDFYGEKVYNEDDPVFQKGLDILKQQGESLIPFSFKNNPKEEPKEALSRQWTEQKFGIMDAPKERQRTETQNAIMKAYIQQVGTHAEGKTHAQMEQSIARRRLREYIYNGGTWEDADPDLKEKANVVRTGQFVNNAKLNPYEFYFKSLTKEKRTALFEDMTEEEQEQFKKYVPKNTKTKENEDND